MKAKEAREIIDHPENYSDIGPFGHAQIWTAKGYLEAHKKAEGLVIALDHIQTCESPTKDCIRAWAEKALAKYEGES